MGDTQPKTRAPKLQGGSHLIQGAGGGVGPADSMTQPATSQRQRAGPHTRSLVHKPWLGER